MTNQTAFQPQLFNEDFDHSQKYERMFRNLGFEPSRIVVSTTNGLSVYVTINANVLKEGKMYAETFVYDSRVQLKIRISDHRSNLEKICGGVCGNTLSYVAFLHLVENNVIEQ